MWSKRQMFEIYPHRPGEESHFRCLTFWKLFLAILSEFLDLPMRRRLGEEG